MNLETFLTQFRSSKELWRQVFEHIILMNFHEFKNIHISPVACRGGRTGRRPGYPRQGASKEWKYKN